MGEATATLIKDKLEGFRGHAALYRLTPPIKDYEYVIASAVTTMQFGGDGPETYLFPATAEGEIVNFGELPGSMKGTLSHAEALLNAGYSLAKAEA